MIPTEKHPEGVHPVVGSQSRESNRPQDIYRLAVIVEGLLDSVNDPDALKTIRSELRELISDLAPTP